MLMMQTPRGANHGGVLLNTYEFASQYISTVILDKYNFFKESTTMN
jgi:hypothetical protein